jgi:predicted RNA-binding protein YlqC (UPF0109 family)
MVVEDSEADETQDELQDGMPAEGSMMQALVEYMARGLVEHPDDVSVTAVEGKGKIIGKEGRVAKAMRTLLKVTAAKEGKRAILEII